MLTCSKPNNFFDLFLLHLLMDRSELSQSLLNAPLSGANIVSHAPEANLPMALIFMHFLRYLNRTSFTPLHAFNESTTFACQL
jgi:hypothetical protein